MADLDTTKANGGWVSLDERTNQNSQEIQISVGEVIGGLMAVADKHPETSSAMQIAKKMLERLDTLRDELKLRATLGKHYLDCSDEGHLMKILNDMAIMAGGRGDKHSLAIDKVYFH